MGLHNKRGFSSKKKKSTPTSQPLRNDSRKSLPVSDLVVPPQTAQQHRKQYERVVRISNSHLNMFGRALENQNCSVPEKADLNSYPLEIISWRFQECQNLTLACSSGSFRREISRTMNLTLECSLSVSHDRMLGIFTVETFHGFHIQGLEKGWDKLSSCLLWF